MDSHYKFCLQHNDRETTIAKIRQEGVLVFTSKRSHESLHGAGFLSQNEVAADGRGEGDGEAEDAHDETSHSQVDQDEVQGLLELLVLERDQQRESVDGGSSADQEEHVDSQQLEHDRIGKIVLRVFKGASYKPSPVGHGDVEVLSLCSVGLHPHSLYDVPVM